MTDEKDLQQANGQQEENVDNQQGDVSPGQEAPPGPEADQSSDAAFTQSPAGTPTGDSEVAIDEAPSESDPSAADAAEEPGSTPATDQDAPEADAEADMLAMLEDLPEENPQTSPEEINFSSAKASRAEFQHLSEPAERPTPRNIDLLMDVNLPVSIELGRTRLSISDILALGPGSVVELSKLAGEPVDVLVNYKAVAKGEVVVIDENFGVRITQLMTPEERLRSIAEEQ
jgi:flagellar motor switch protein FliN/FliY